MFVNVLNDGVTCGDVGYVIRFSERELQDKFPDIYDQFRNEGDNISDIRDLIAEGALCGSYYNLKKMIRMIDLIELGQLPDNFTEHIKDIKFSTVKAHVES